MSKFTSTIEWTGNIGNGTKDYHSYDRTWQIVTPGKSPIHCSNDPLLGGDPRLHNPEDLLISALSACHMLWYLHLASDAGIQVQAYLDTPIGIGETHPSGKGGFLEARLRPNITLEPGTDENAADRLHSKIHDVCFIARSVSFPVFVDATYSSST